QIVPRRIGFQVHLKGSDAVGGLLPDHGRRHLRPAEEARQDVRGYLAAVQGTRREVPQRRLTLRGLVDRQHPTRVVLPALPEADQERVVRRPAEEALQLDAGKPEQVSLYRYRVKGLAGSHW